MLLLRVVETDNDPEVIGRVDDRAPVIDHRGERLVDLRLTIETATSPTTRRQTAKPKRARTGHFYHPFPKAVQRGTGLAARWRKC